MRKIGDLFFGIFLFLIPLFASGQGLKVYSTVDRNEMGLGDSFTLTVSISSQEAVSIEDPRLPDLTGFDLVNNWQGSEARSSFSNGKFTVERTQTFNYMLAPKQKGNLTLGPVEVIVDGQKFNTQAIKVLVTDSGVSPPSRPNQPRGVDPQEEIEDLFSQFLRNRPRPGFRSEPVNPKDAFFIQVEADKTKVYEGEQITASWYLYTRGQISDIDTLKYPSLKGFWKEDIEVATRLNFETEVLNGIPYKKALLASYALFPIKAGVVAIDPYKARCTVLTATNFGFGRPYQYTKSSKAVRIDVLPVPKENRPSDYSGAVGKFNVTASLDSKNVPINQPIALKIKFEGKGNAKLIDLPAFHLPPSIEVYDTKKESKFFSKGNSYKEFEVLLIPREVGEIVIPSISVSLFDPDKKSFYQRATPSVKINVVPGSNEQSIPSSPVAAATNNDIEDQGPRLPNLILAAGDSFSLSGLQYASLWTVAYILAFFFLLWRAVVELGIGRQQQGVSEILKARFKRIYVDLESGNWRGVGVGVTNTFYYLLGEISGEGGANLQVEKLLLKAPPSVRRELGDSITEQMKKFELLSFAPEAVVGQLKEKPELKKNVSEIEKTLYKAVKLGLGSNFEEKDTTTGDRP